MSVAVLTIAHGRHDHLRGQIAGLAAGRRRPDLHVITAMDDPQISAVAAEAWDDLARSGRPSAGVVVTEVPADPLGLPLALARNHAAAAATAFGADDLVFLDVDCIPGPGTVETYARELALLSAHGDGAPSAHGDGAPSAHGDGAPHTPAAAAPAVLCGDVAYLPPQPQDQADWATPEGLARLSLTAEHRADRVRLAPGERLPEPDLTRFWSLSFALRVSDFWATGGFCTDYVGYGGEDTDFAQVVGARGGSLTWVGGATAYHQHHPSPSPPLQHLDAIIRNAGIYADRWGTWPMEGWLEGFRERGLAAPGTDGRWRVTA